MKQQFLIVNVPDEEDDELEQVYLFGPYATKARARMAQETLPEEYTSLIVSNIHLTEALDNPAGYIAQGDSPEWTI